MASDGSVVLIEPTLVPLPNSPHASLKGKSKSNGSMISIRLSEPESLNETELTDEDYKQPEDDATANLEHFESTNAPLSSSRLSESTLAESSDSDDTDSDDDDADSVHSDATIEAEPQPNRLSMTDYSSSTTDYESSTTSDDESEDIASDIGRYDGNDDNESLGPRLSVAFSEVPESIIEFPAFERSRSASASSRSSAESLNVDWNELEKTEESTQRDEASDESTAFLLARLEQENNALAHNPRAGMHNRVRNESRPPSIQVLKKMVRDPSEVERRTSLICEPPPMTELEFWAALVKDYPQTAQRLPTLTANKIKGGVPPPLRGVVWMSMVGGSRDKNLGDEFDKLCLESSPYDTMIGKDIGRSFPGVEMFKEPGGEGQQMLGRVLKCFSLHDKEIGYCQGLGFLVGPLLMQMGDKDAFCVLVGLMESYNLRSCYLPDLSGLHLRIYQFQQLLNQHMPELSAYLASLQVEAAYLSQWFLSFFAVTCPLPMLFRIYDVILAEGASETIMRVALSLMRRNESKLMAMNEFEEVMQLLLSRSLWEPYSHNADELVNDFTGWTGLVTREALQTLEASFKEAPHDDTVVKQAFFPSVTAAASGFLGRLWTSKPTTLSPEGRGHVKTSSFSLKRSASKQSITTINSADSSSEGTGSSSTALTESSTATSDTSSDSTAVHSKSPSLAATAALGHSSKEDKDLHGQIEDLLTAITEMQREQAILHAQVQRQKEDRMDDHKLFAKLINDIKELSSSEWTSPAASKAERRVTAPAASGPELSSSLRNIPVHLADSIVEAEERMHRFQDLRGSSTLETKQRLRDSLIRSKDQLNLEAQRNRDLSSQLDTQEKESGVLRDELREARVRISEGFQERQKLERQLQEIKSNRKQSMVWTDLDRPLLSRSETSDSLVNRMSFSSTASASSPATPITGGGLRELKLGAARPPSGSTITATNGHARQSTKGSNSNVSTASTSIPQRGSSLATRTILSTKNHAPQSEDEMLVELVNAKTAEAVARQELEQAKAELQGLRKMLAMPSPPISTTTRSDSVQSSGSQKATPTESSFGIEIPAVTGLTMEKTKPTKTDSTSSTPPSSKATTPAATIMGGGFWSWGRKVTGYGATPVKKEKGKDAEKEADEAITPKDTTEQAEGQDEAEGNTDSSAPKVWSNTEDSTEPSMSVAGDLDKRTL